MNNGTPVLLVVDDEPDLRLLVKLLVGEEYEVVEACDGHEAVDVLARRYDIDIVLLDIRIPGIDGFGVLERLAAMNLPHQIQVIAFSAHAERAVVERATERGVRGFVSKPFAPEELIAALSAARPVPDEETAG